MIQANIESYLNSEELLSEVKRIDANNDSNIEGTEFLNFKTKWNEEHPERQILQNLTELSDDFTVSY